MARGAGPGEPEQKQKAGEQAGETRINIPKQLDLLFIYDHACRIIAIINVVLWSFVGVSNSL